MAGRRSDPPAFNPFLADLFIEAPVDSISIPLRQV